LALAGPPEVLDGPGGSVGRRRQVAVPQLHGAHVQRRPADQRVVPGAHGGGVGPSDDRAAVATHEAVASDHPGSRIAILDGAHLIYQDAPADVVAEIREFLAATQ